MAISQQPQTMFAQRRAQEFQLGGERGDETLEIIVGCLLLG